MRLNKILTSLLHAKAIECEMMSYRGHTRKSAAKICLKRQSKKLVRKWIENEMFDQLEEYENEKYENEKLEKEEDLIRVELKKYRKEWKDEKAIAMLEKKRLEWLALVRKKGFVFECDFGCEEHFYSKRVS